MPRQPPSDKFLADLLAHQDVVIVRYPNSPDEERIAATGSIQSRKGIFAASTPLSEGDLVEVADPRGGVRHLVAVAVEITNLPDMPEFSHLTATWGAEIAPRVASIRRVGLEGLHPAIVAATSDLFTDGHPEQAIFEAFKSVEIRVRELSGVEASGQPLMATAFGSHPPVLRVAPESEPYAEDEQNGFKLIFMGAMTGVRNPKAHHKMAQPDPQRAIEYLAFASLLMRRLDDAEELLPPRI